MPLRQLQYRFDLSCFDPSIQETFMRAVLCKELGWTGKADANGLACHADGADAQARTAVGSTFPVHPTLCTARRA